MALFFMLPIFFIDVSYVTGVPLLLGGENAVIIEHPYQVSIERLGHYHCGGAIVNNRYILTTASCAQVSHEELSVRAASSLQGEGGAVYKVNKVVVHEKYVGLPKVNGSSGVLPGYDVAVMRISQDFVMGDECQPAELYKTKEVAEPGKEAVLTSWGDFGGGQPSRQMQLVRLSILANSTCSEELAKREGAPSLNEESGGQICASASAKAACIGDAGSPLKIEGRLAGIAAWGFPCDQPAGPSVFTDIGHFRAWIDEHAAF